MIELHNCRLCPERKPQPKPEMVLIQYSTRHWAHMKCLHDRGRLKEVLEKTPVHVLNHLPYFGIAHLGLASFYRELIAQKEGK